MGKEVWKKVFRNVIHNSKYTSDSLAVTCELLQLPVFNDWCFSSMIQQWLPFIDII